MEKKKRKQNRLKNFDYCQNGAYFITICTKDRQPVLSEITVGEGFHALPNIKLTKIGNDVEKSIQYINDNIENVSVDNYVIMPNHIHIIISIKNVGGRGSPPLQEIIKRLKTFTTKQYGKQLWQRSFYDHIIRDDIDYMTKYQYIDENPLKWAEDKYYQPSHKQNNC